MIAVEADYEGVSGALGVILAEDSLAASLTASMSPSAQAPWIASSPPSTCRTATSFPSCSKGLVSTDLIIHSLVVLLSGRVPEA